MMTVALVLLFVLSVMVIMAPRRRRKGEPFDWTHRRRWWRPRWAFPDDR